MMPNSDDFPPCPARQKMVSFNADGSKTPLFRCTESEAEFAHQDVTPSDCDACPLREDLTKKAGERIPVIQYTKKAKDTSCDGFLPCEDRIVIDVPSCCGQVYNLRMCESLASHLYKKEVSPVICSQCKVRREAPPSQST